MTKRSDVKWRHWILPVLAALSLLSGVVSLVQQSLYELAGRLIPQPPPDDIRIEAVRSPVAQPGEERFDAFGGTGILPEGLPLDHPVALHVSNEGTWDVIAGDYVLFVQDVLVRERLLALARQHGVHVEFWQAGPPLRRVEG